MGCYPKQRSAGKDNATVRGSDPRKKSSSRDRNRKSRRAGARGTARPVTQRHPHTETAPLPVDAVRGLRRARADEQASSQLSARESGASSASGRWRRRDHVSVFGRRLSLARIRRFGLSVAAADGVVVLLAVSLALIGVISRGVGMASLPATVAELWMALNLVPFAFNGTTLGLIPAVPAIAMVAFLAWRIRREVADRISLRDVRALVAAYLGTPLILTVIAWLMLYDASQVFQRIKLPNFGIALLATLLVHLAALFIGMGQRLLRALLRRRRLPEWLLTSARLAATYVLWLCAAGLVAVVASLAWHYKEALAATAITSSVGENVALWGLALLYLPNVVLGAVAVLLGGSANVGVAEVSLFAVTPGQLPPLPILAAMPQSLLSPTFGVLVVVPAAIAVWRVIKFLKSADTERPYLIIVAAAVWSGIYLLVLAWLFGGEVGFLGWSGASWWLTGLLGSMWFVVPGAIVVVAMTGMPSVGGYREKPEIAAERFGDVPEGGDDSADPEGAPEGAGAAEGVAEEGSEDTAEGSNDDAETETEETDEEDAEEEQAPVETEESSESESDDDGGDAAAEAGANPEKEEKNQG
ncbi:hypothetical protein CLAC_02600 [Corynebacterium lactis RW2-5]|uniref:Uncharacterized protein n=1 Tax=Corynebacterium lactis RW2-5 TaxID=1408189 RepID=A0A0K2H399_9CORY|nr:hypothetical protein CLAC_02600 [Corynebacterium lactis RW2-5]